ncbi:MAG TPA: anthranilate phosphoribosyltransferase [Actinomycetota bacterium]|nr:anthranilate phosphoribosyltransferase [Actinomycetota bacterium]
MSEWPALLSRLLAGEALSAGDAHAAMGAIMDGEATQAQIAGFVVALRAKGETPEEIEGLARAMLERAQPVETPGPVVDTCGTGGDRAGTINVSTVAALVVAGAGVTVAKHGNRAASSRCGSADLLEALGVKIDLGPDGVARCLAEAGIGFMFASVYHPAMAHAAVPRRELGIPTVFNFLGPLTNPARPAAQVVGVSDPRMLPKLAMVLARRGTRAMVVRGADGLDELTVTGPSDVHDVSAGVVRSVTVDPASLGLPTHPPGAVAGGDAEHNAAVARAIVAGEPGPSRDIVLLNAAAVLTVAGVAPSIEEGLGAAAESIDAGRAAAALTRLIETSNAP